MSTETRLDALENIISKLTADSGSRMGVPTKSWEFANLAPGAIKDIYNAETKSLIIEHQGNLYMSTVVNLGIHSAPIQGVHGVLWLRQGNLNPLPTAVPPKPLTKDDPRVATNGLPTESLAFLIDMAEFPEPKTQSESMASLHVSASLPDKYNGYEKVMGGRNGTGIYLGEDGTIMIKGPNSEVSLGPNGTIIGGDLKYENTQNDSGVVSSGGIMKIIPPTVVTINPHFIPNIDFISQVTAISSAVIGLSKTISSLA